MYWTLLWLVYCCITCTFLLLYVFIHYFNLFTCTSCSLTTLNKRTWWGWWPWVTSDPDFKVTTFLKSNIRKEHKDKVTIAQEESIPNIWNHTMFGDLDWPLNASRGFVSISWVSCLHSFMALRDFGLLLSLTTIRLVRQDIPSCFQKWHVVCGYHYLFCASRFCSGAAFVYFIHGGPCRCNQDT